MPCKCFKCRQRVMKRPATIAVPRSSTTANSSSNSTYPPPNVESKSNESVPPSSVTVSDRDNVKKAKVAESSTNIVINLLDDDDESGEDKNEAISVEMLYAQPKRRYTKVVCLRTGNRAAKILDNVLPCKITERRIDQLQAHILSLYPDEIIGQISIFLQLKSSFQVLLIDADLAIINEMDVLWVCAGEEVPCLNKQPMEIDVTTELVKQQQQQFSFHGTESFWADIKLSKLIRQIGETSLYRAELNGSAVALKTIRMPYSEDRKEHFNTEFSVLISLSMKALEVSHHQSNLFVPILHVSDDNSAWENRAITFVTPWNETGSFADLLLGTKASVDFTLLEKVSILIATVEAIDAIHSSGAMTLGSIDLNNLYRTDANSAKLLITRLYDDSFLALDHFTSSRSVDSGALALSDPVARELANGNKPALEIWKTFDITAIGRIIMELITQKSCFGGLRSFQVLHANSLEQDTYAVSSCNLIDSKHGQEHFEDSFAGRHNRRIVNRALKDLSAVVNVCFHNPQAYTASALREKLNNIQGIMSTPVPPPPPDHLLCSITLDIMKEPVICDDGHTYEKAAITDWLTRSQISPRTNQPLKGIICVNHGIKDAIEYYKAQYSYIED